MSALIEGLRKTRGNREVTKVNIMRQLSTQRLFVADYSALANIPLVEGRVFYAPQVWEGIKNGFFS